MEQALEILNNKPQHSSFGDNASFEHAQRVAKMLASSTLIPKEYQGNIQNTMIALEMSNRIGASPLMVMQNLYIVQGRPSWSSTFIIASINSCGNFSPLRYDMQNEGTEQMTCSAWAYDKETKEKLYGPMVTIQMAKDEGWLNKNGSKWKTMPSLMIRYRAAAFFGRLYAPEIMMGMQTMEELQDVYAPAEVVKPDREAERVKLLIEEATELTHLTEELWMAAKDTNQLPLFDTKREQLENDKG